AEWNGTQYPATSFQFSFDISGQSQKVTQSQKTIQSYNKDGQPKRNFRGAINVNEDGTVDGVDVLIPYLTYQETRTYGGINASFINVLASIVGSVNLNDYAGYKAGELLLTRCSGSQREDGNWDLTFAWSVSRNASSLIVGDIQGIVKDGWDYLWIYYGVQHDPDTLCTHKVPLNAYVERVYARTDFSQIAIT
ncbi:MAG: hypothetical protein ACRYGG_07385, partial [Janthinobacterium lividum]